MRKMIAVIAVLLIAGSVFAHIGETLEESIKRYGPIQNTEKDDQFGLRLYQFTKGQYQIVIVIGESGKTVKIMYQRKSSSLGLIADLSEREIKNLLEAEKRGKWINSKVADDSGSAWGNGDFNADYATRNGTLSITGPEYSSLLAR